jgi:hypothetical protein
MTRAYKRTAHGRITPALRAKGERLIELNEAHLNAIRGEDDAFYSDGRHEELVTLSAEINRVLGIRPWEDAEAILAEAIA